MLSTSLAFLVSLVVTAVMTRFVRDFAIRRNLTAAPRAERDVHKVAIPRVGGIAIAIGFMVPLIGLFLLDSGIGRFIQRDPDWLKYVIALGGGSLAIVAIGIYDDIRGANAYQKLAVQILVAVFVWSLGVGIDRIGLFGAQIDTGIFSLPITVVWIVVVINAMNLIDGLDGLASGVGLMAVLPNLILAVHNQNVVMMVLMAALGGAILGFLVYNFRPASIFMGDTGSMFLGFVLATGSVLGNVKSTATVSMIAPVLALGLPIMDVLLAVFRRSMRGLPLFGADNDHVHHRLLKRGMSHRDAVLALYGFSFFLAAAALISVFMRGRLEVAGLILMLAVSFGFFIRQLGYLWRLPRVSRRSSESDLTNELRAVCADLRQSVDLTAIWRAIHPLKELLPISSLQLEVGEECYSWRAASGSSAALARVDLAIEAKPVGELRVEWEAFERLDEEETALAQVSSAVSEAVARVRLAPASNVIPLRGRVSSSAPSS